MKFHKYDISEVVNQLPDIQPFSPNMDCELFICTLGFEDRAHHIIDQFFKQGQFSIKTLILIRYPTNLNDNNANYKYFQKALGHDIELIEIEYDKTTFYDKFIELIERNTSENNHVLFDVSTCASYVFYPVMKALIDSKIRLSIAYTEALVYYPKEEEWLEVSKEAEKENELFMKSFENAKFLSTGIDDIYISQLFDEMNHGNKPSTLIAVPNFSALRMNAIKHKDNDLNKTSSENIVWLIGDPPADSNKWRKEALLKTNNLGNVESGSLTEVSTFYYKKMLEILESIWFENKHKSYLTIGSLGSKMQHVGTFFFLCLHPEVGLWLAEPKEFNAKKFSEDCGDSWSLYFGRTDELLSKLSKYNTFDWEF